VKGTSVSVQAVADMGDRSISSWFSIGLEWGDATNWQALSRGGVRMMIGHCPDAMLPAQTGDHSYFAYLHVDDVDALYAEFVQRGAIVRQLPTDRLWGMREMAVATPDGHRMMIGQKI
jgi:uncharacterized glyoxalase superfamily protein PhnB